MSFVVLWGYQLHGLKRAGAGQLLKSRNFLLILGLIILDTICYNLPSTLYSLESFDFQTVPPEFYSFYCLFLTMIFISILAFSVVIFIMISSKDYKSKILCSWLIIAELATLIDHVLRKYLLINWHSDYQKPITLAVFAIICIYFAYRALFKPRSETFRPNRTYIINFLPKNIFAIFTWIAFWSGHKAIYQDGKLIRFKESSGMVEIGDFQSRMVNYERMIFEEVPRVKDLDSFIGKKYNLLTYNCNHLVKYATGH